MIETVKKNEFRKFFEIRDIFVSGREIFHRSEPANVGPSEAVRDGGVDIDLFIGMPVVVPMGGSPPEWSSLHGAISQCGEEELDRARGLEGFVGEIAMVESGDSKHSNHVEENRGHYDDPTDADPEDGEAAKVEEHKRKGPFPIDLVGKFLWIRGVTPTEVGIQPLSDDAENRLKETLLSRER